MSAFHPKQTVAAFFRRLRAHRRVEGWYKPLPTSAWFRAHGPELVRRFGDEKIPDAERYRTLFNYFLAGFLEFVTRSGERVHYPGLKGMRGHSVEGLEGFARTAPLLAAWLSSGRPSAVEDPRWPGRLVDLRHLLRRAVLTGTDPRSPVYWGDMADRDQRIVEAADIALLLWLSRNQVWSSFSPLEREQVAGWLRQVERNAPYRNNWLLFRVQVIETLRALGMPADERLSAETYLIYKQLYLGFGWFDDPPGGVDYYNAWGISYSLFWIDQLNPDFDPTFIREALRESALLLLHLVGLNGVPIMGRSMCYRLAIPAPILMQSSLDARSIDPGQARRALDVVWRHFVDRGALAQGRVEQGYYGRDPRLIEPYLGPGSCQWSVRSLVLAFLQPEASAFWQNPQQALPIELGDYRFELPALGWVVEGHRASGEIVIRVPANCHEKHCVEEHTMVRRLAELLLAAPFRPDNHKAKYFNPAYSSATPLGTRPAKKNRSPKAGDL